MYYVYLLECRDKSIYTGITTDVARRLKEHKAGLASRYTRAKEAVKILHTERFKTRSQALKREFEIKHWNRRKKLSLVRKGRPNVSERLSESEEVLSLVRRM